jgi:hypothetical protein
MRHGDAKTKVVLGAGKGKLHVIAIGDYELACQSIRALPFPTSIETDARYVELTRARRLG